MLALACVVLVRVGGERLDHHRCHLLLLLLFRAHGGAHGGAAINSSAQRRTNRGQVRSRCLTLPRCHLLNRLAARAGPAARPPPPTGPTKWRKSDDPKARAKSLALTSRHTTQHDHWSPSSRHGDECDQPCTKGTHSPRAYSSPCSSHGALETTTERVLQFRCLSCMLGGVVVGCHSSTAAAPTVVIYAQLKAAKPDRKQQPTATSETNTTTTIDTDVPWYVLHAMVCT